MCYRRGSIANFDRCDASNYTTTFQLARPLTSPNGLPQNTPPVVPSASLPDMESAQLPDTSEPHMLLIAFMLVGVVAVTAVGIALLLARRVTAHRGHQRVIEEPETELQPQVPITDGIMLVQGVASGSNLGYVGASVVGTAQPNTSPRRQEHSARGQASLDRRIGTLPSGWPPNYTSASTNTTRTADPCIRSAMPSTQPMDDRHTPSPSITTSYSHAVESVDDDETTTKI